MIEVLLNFSGLKFNYGIYMELEGEREKGE